MNKRLTKTLIIIGIVFMCVFFLLTVIVLRGEEDSSNSNKPMPIAQYDNPLYKLLLNYVYEDEFQEADSGERMGLFINELSNIENGTEACEIGVVSFDADEYNHSIKFCGSDGMWWILYTDTMCFEAGDSHGVLKRFTRSQEFIDADILTQVDMFCFELDSLSETDSADFNAPYIVSDSIQTDSDTMTVKYCDTNGFWYEYHFDTQQLLNCNAQSILEYLVGTDAFVNSNIDIQIDMFYQSLLSVSENSSEGINTPVIADDSVEMDKVNYIIYYRYADTSVVRYYSFVNHEFGFASRLTVTPEP